MSPSRVESNEFNLYMPQREQLARRLSQSPNSKSAYLGLIDIGSYPKTPDDLPEDKIYLPPELIGNAGDIIQESLSVGRERLQFTSWDKEGRQFKHGRIYKGREWNTGILSGVMMRVRDSSLYRGNNLLMNLHTHPDHGYPFYSERDISLQRYRKNPPYITAVGSRKALFAAFLTEKFQSGDPNFLMWEMNLMLNFSHSMFLDWLTNPPPEQFSQIYHEAKVLENLGLGIYYLASKSGLRLQDFKNGVEVKRMVKKEVRSGLLFEMPKRIAS